MNALRMFLVTSTVVAMFAPLAAHAGGSTSAASCAPAPMTQLERRLAAKSGDGMPALISFVHRTQPIYQVRVEDAVAIVEAQHAQRGDCVAAVSRPTAY